MKKYVSRGLLAALCASALVPTVSDAATVTIRVEGDAQTLVAETTVSTSPGDVVKDGDPKHRCEAANAIGALEQSTAGDWSGPYYDGFGYAPEIIRGERHSFADSSYYGFFFNKRFSDVGLCDRTLQDGDEILLYPACASSGCAAAQPLDVSFPRVVQAREPFAVKVERLADSGSRTAAQGATVTVAGRSATAGADGTATVSIDQPSDVELAATAPNTVRDTGNRICVHDGNDGRCGFPKSDGSAAPTAAPATQQQASAQFVRDRTAPRSSILGIREGQTFARLRAPRVLRGALEPDPSGIFAVKVRLTRNDGGRCSAYSVRRERFVRTRCGATQGWYSRIGDRAAWEYQLASRLPRGRYVLDVNAVDKAFNRDDERRRGENRLVFRVR